MRAVRGAATAIAYCALLSATAALLGCGPGAARRADREIVIRSLEIHEVVIAALTADRDGRPIVQTHERPIAIEVDDGQVEEVRRRTARHVVRYGEDAPENAVLMRCGEHEAKTPGDRAFMVYYRTGNVGASWYLLHFRQTQADTWRLIEVELYASS